MCDLDNQKYNYCDICGCEIITTDLLCHNCQHGVSLLKGNGGMAIKYLFSGERSSWNSYFMSLALLASTRSKDKSTKVGAVIVKDRVVVSTGYNGFPRGVNDDIPERQERPLKYSFVCHAEENAILNAARIGAKVAESDIYVTLFPCSNCAKAIVQSQIRTVYVLDSSNERWDDDFKISTIILNEGGVYIRKIDI